MEILEDLKTVQKARDDIKKALQDVGGGIITNDITTYADIIRKIGSERNAAVRDIDEIKKFFDEFMGVDSSYPFDNRAFPFFLKSICTPIDFSNITANGDLFSMCQLEYICIENLSPIDSSFSNSKIKELELVNLKLSGTCAIIQSDTYMTSLHIHNIDLTELNTLSDNISTPNLIDFKITGEIKPPINSILIGAGLFDSWTPIPLSDESLEYVLNFFIAVGDKISEMSWGSVSFQTISGLTSEQIIKMQELYPDKVAQLEALNYDFNR